MQGVVLALFGAALAVGLAELLLPVEEGGTARVFRFLVSLVILLLILAPFMGLLANSETLLSGEIVTQEAEQEAFEEIFFDTVSAQGRAEFEKGLYTLLEAEYGIPPKNVTLLVRYGAEGELAGVSVFLSGGALLQNPETLSRELTKKLGCTVEVR